MRRGAHGVAILGALAACKPSTVPAAADAGGAAATTATAASSTADGGAAATAATAIPRPAPPPCRAILVVGTAHARVGGLAAAGMLKTGDTVAAWLTLDPGARVTVKEPSSARELLFTGGAGASVLPCFHESEAWLASGEFVGERGSGERPGADQWVVTPFAVVRYDAAIVDVTVDATGARAVLKGGGASAIASDGDTWHALDPAAPFVAKGTLDENASAAAAARCVRTETAAKALEDALLAPGETRDPGFGDLARRATEARTLAHAACAISALRAAKAREKAGEKTGEPR